MNRIRLLLAAAFGFFTITAVAQNTPPVVTNPIADFTQYPTTQRSIDLTTVFADSDASAAVHLFTDLGHINIVLFRQQKPVTVANFLNYVNQGRYFQFDPPFYPSFIHRSIPGFIIQGGGFLATPDPADPNKQNAKPTQVLAFAPIQNEPGISNKRGTIAMAQAGSDANSATSQWFINLADNGGPPNNLDIRFTPPGGNPAGPYTVFGRVAGDGMTVVDAIAAVPRVNAGVPFDNLPVRNYTSPNPIKVANLVSVPGIGEIFPLIFSVVSDNASVSVSLSGTNLLVKGNSVGTAHVTVTATDLDGATVSQMFTVNVIAAPGRLVQLSTRMQVGTGDNALFGGFIMRGAASKRLMIRGIGPSTGLPGALANPVLELRDNNGIIATNDNWFDAPNAQDMIDAHVAPREPNESGILITVPSNTTNAFYTAIVTGANNTSGLGLVEVYDLDFGPGSTLLNISTRGQVGVDPNELIAGFFVGGSESKQILIRGIGPSLASANITNFLADPILEVHDAQGGVFINDDWGQSADKTAIQNSGLAPTNAKESAVLRILPPGPYTAILRGTNSTTGVGSVEVYQL
jgi:cyclophilin family peptidyl-prolyl cis-trans isomerase